MSRRRWTVLVLCLASLLAPVTPASAQLNRIDAVTPMAPELAPYGPMPIGVRTVTVMDRGRADVLNTKPGSGTVRYDRPLVVEVWYPAAPGSGRPGDGEYRTISRDPARTITLKGRAVRDAAAETSGAPYPLVILSHGYPGNRYLLSHLGENLASKGFVVASIDHKDSTYDDQQAVGSPGTELEFAL